MKLSDIKRTPEGWVKGYKAFNHDWSCHGGYEGKYFQYTCPGEFIENVKPELCKKGLHFCINLKDCFNYYIFENHIRLAEVIAKGDIDINEDSEDSKCCTNHLKIVKEISVYDALFELNDGNFNVGFNNKGMYNLGNWNDGMNNNGEANCGNYNRGYKNKGDFNDGSFNIGNFNNGNSNNGDHNHGEHNIGSFNVGNFNYGNKNFGVFNKGNNNYGSFNLGDNLKGTFNKPCDDCDKHRIYLNFITFPSKIMYTSALNNLIVKYKLMSFSDEIKSKIKYINYTSLNPNDICEIPDNILFLLRQLWWINADIFGKKIILELPNFDAEIFKAITGIDINMNLRTDTNEFDLQKCRDIINTEI